MNTLLLSLLLLAPVPLEQEICLKIDSIDGIYCYAGADEVGDCGEKEEVVYCKAYDPETLPLWASWYNPELGGINCGGSCDYLATGRVEDWMYGHAAACPPGWTLLYNTRVIETNMGEFECLDRGPRIVPMWREIYGPDGFEWRWVIVIDFLFHERPSWGYSVIEEWGLR